jgi:hypothetical protein
MDDLIPERSCLASEFYKTEQLIAVGRACELCGTTENLYMITVEFHGDKPSILESQRNNWVKPMRVGVRCVKCAEPLLTAVRKSVREYRARG